MNQTNSNVFSSVVVQLAKAKGYVQPLHTWNQSSSKTFRLKVIASAGADSKVEYMRSLGADVAFNYKTTPIAQVLEEHGPLVADSYFR
jgi:NADPH:quinone reductase-like Zn-dependent oxidoreductase